MHTNIPLSNKWLAGKNTQPILSLKKMYFGRIFLQYLLKSLLRKQKKGKSTSWPDPTKVQITWATPKAAGKLITEDGGEGSEGENSQGSRDNNRTNGQLL